MKKTTLFLLCLFFFSQFVYSHEKNLSTAHKNILIVKNMFSEFAEKLDIAKLDTYYSKQFVLESNGKTYSYKEYKDLEGKIFKTLSSLRVVKYYDIFSTSNKVVSRMSIELIKKNGEKNTFRVFLIALIENNKIKRIWELTYPSWSRKLIKANKSLSNTMQNLAPTMI